MKNEYGDHCYLCGRWVEANTGHFEVLRNRLHGEKNWRVRHAQYDFPGAVRCEEAPE